MYDGSRLPRRSATRCEELGERLSAIGFRDAHDNVELMSEPWVGTHVVQRAEGTPVHIHCAKHDAVDSSLLCCAGTHDTGFECHDKGVSIEAPRSGMFCGISQGQYLGMGGWIASELTFVVSCGHNVTGGIQDDGTDGNVIVPDSGLGFGESGAHWSGPVVIRHDKNSNFIRPLNLGVARAESHHMKCAALFTPGLFALGLTLLGCGTDAPIGPEPDGVAMNVDEASNATVEVAADVMVFEINGEEFELTAGICNTYDDGSFHFALAEGPVGEVGRGTATIERFDTGSGYEIIVAFEGLRDDNSELGWYARGSVSVHELTVAVFGGSLEGAALFDSVGGPETPGDKARGTFAIRCAQ